MRVGLILFVVFGGFFELIFSAGARFGVRQIVFPVALILLGLYLIFKRLQPSQPETIDSSTTNDLENKQ